MHKTTHAYQTQIVDRKVTVTLKRDRKHVCFQNVVRLLMFVFFSGNVCCVESWAQQKNEGAEPGKQQQQAPSPFTEPQKRSKRIRYNSGSWHPLVDITEIFPGNRHLNDRGLYDLYDGVIGVQLRVEPAERSQVLLEAVAEWEDGESISPLFIWEADGLWHMLYECSGAGGGNTAYCTSVDGYQWKRVELGQVSFRGSTKNNLVANGIQGATGAFLDPHAPPDERFKAMGGDMAWYDPQTLQRMQGPEVMRRWNKQQQLGSDYKGPRVEIWGRMLGWVSSDGLNWKQLDTMLGNRPVNGGISACYDADNDEYIAYLQIMGNTAELIPGIGTAQIEEQTQRRTIGFSRTKDFGSWPAPKLILSPDAQDDLDTEFYGGNYFPYPGRTDLHAMVVPLYHKATDHMDMQIAFSRDGIIWSRPERRAIHTVGEHGSGEECAVHAWRSGLLELPDGSWAVPYTGSSTRHNVLDPDKDEIFPDRRPRQIRYMLWQPHRFCGIEATGEGRFTIPTIYRHGNELRLNYRCEPGGWLTVELVRNVGRIPDPEGVEGFTFADCDRLAGNESDRVVTWKGNSDISQLGETVAIRVRMFQAKLFAYRI